MVSEKSAAESVRSWGSFGLSRVLGHDWSHRMERSASNTGINTDIYIIYIIYIYIYNYNINTVYDR